MDLDAQPLGEGLRGGGDGLRATRRFSRRARRAHNRRRRRRGRCRRFRPAFGANVIAGNDDARQPIQQLLAGGDTAIEIGREAVGAAQPLAEAGFAFLHSKFEAGDGAFGDFGGRDQFGDCRPQRLLVGL